MSNSADNAPVT